MTIKLGQMAVSSFRDIEAHHSTKEPECSYDAASEVYDMLDRK